MKIAVSGKGGVGKTTLTALLARAWVRDGYKVLAIDADPVASLAGALGFPEPDKIVPLSEMSDLIEERTGAKAGSIGQMFSLNPKVDDLPEKIAKEHNGIKLIVMGGIRTGGSGCACPESALVKALLRHIILDRDERVIMDMDAGIEHLGRSTADAVNSMITVVEPGLRSIETARKIQKLAGDIGVKKIWAVANKVRNNKERQFIEEHLDNLKTIAFIPFSEKILENDRISTSEINDPEVIKEVEKVKERIQGG